MMTIQELKELENLKKTKEDLITNLIKKRSNALKYFLDSVITDFKKFFKAQEFKIEENGLNITATYLNLQAILNIPNDVYNFPIFNLLLLYMPKRIEYTASIFLKEIGDSTSFYNGDSFEIQKEEVKKTIDKLKSQLENYQGNDWTIRLNGTGTLNGRYFDSLHEALSEICINL